MNETRFPDEGSQPKKPNDVEAESSELQQLKLRITDLEAQVANMKETIQVLLDIAAHVDPQAVGAHILDQRTREHEKLRDELAKLDSPDTSTE